MGSGFAQGVGALQSAFEVPLDVVVGAYHDLLVIPWDADCCCNTSTPERENESAMVQQYSSSIFVQPFRQHLSLRACG